jgi:hypothetical protein
MFSGFKRYFFQFEWEEYIVKGMFRNVKNVTVTKDEIILVDDLEYFDKALPLYKQYTETKKK